MKRVALRFSTGVVLAAALCAHLAADGTPKHWSAGVGLGAVDQDAIGGAPTVSLELERRVTPVLGIGVRSGYFTKEGCCGQPRDTLYAVGFARVRWPRAGAQPFAEAGRGPYVFEDDTEHGWFGGLGIDFPFAPTRGLLIAARYHSVSRPREGPLPDFSELQATLRFSF
jgi:hypothetical protein